MSWIAKLNKTYDSVIGKTGSDESKTPLLPVSHTTVQAQISVTVDMDGNFVSASAIPKEAATTVIPCTEASGARTSGKAPHPLCDTLEYIAGDILAYYDVEGESNTRPSKPKDSKNIENIKMAHQEYLDLLKEWCESRYGDDRLSAVLKYVERGSLCSDLVNCGILRLDEEGMLITKWDKETMGEKPELYSVLVGPSVKSFVRWAVYKSDGGDEDLSDPEIWSLWKDFYDSKVKEIDICMVTGEKVQIAEYHPAKIRNAGDSAKLISSNDKSGFTFRGRFITSREACTIGYSASQKAHSALRWLIGKQGYQQEDWCIVSWTVNDGRKVVNPVQDPMDLFAANLTDEDPVAYTGKVSSDKINAMVRGYNGKLDDEDIVIMVMDSASKGRLSVVYYREFSGSEFEGNLIHWYNSCSWPRRYKDAEGNIRITSLPPSLKNIVKCAYGWNVDDNLLKSALNRLMPCVIELAPIPDDIVQSVVNNACKPMSFEGYEWENTLSLACAMYKKQNEKERYEMVLDKGRKTRDYLFGRLLAIADVMESRALFKAGEKRETNAMRSMQRFADRPSSTWRNLNLAIAPYRSRLSNNGSYYDKIISEIMDLFESEDFVNDSRLSGEFLLGFYTQRAELNLRKKGEADETETQEE
jgi:CRISPR-associated protein Csd1